MDGWSIPILLGYIHEVYLKLQSGETVVASIDHSYEYAQKYLQDHQDDNKDYWDKYLLQIEDKKLKTSLFLFSASCKSLSALIFA